MRCCPGRSLNWQAGSSYHVIKIRGLGGRAGHTIDGGAGVVEAEGGSVDDADTSIGGGMGMKVKLEVALGNIVRDAVGTGVLLGVTSAVKELVALGNMVRVSVAAGVLLELIGGVLLGEAMMGGGGRMKVDDAVPLGIIDSVGDGLKLLVSVELRVDILVLVEEGNWLNFFFSSLT